MRVCALLPTWCKYSGAVEPEPLWWLAFWQIQAGKEGGGLGTEIPQLNPSQRQLVPNTQTYTSGT